MSKSNGSVQKSNRDDLTAVHPEPVVAGAVSSSDAETSASLDKVRDILFGAQVRESERRQQRLEDRLFKELADMREEFRKRQDSLDSFVRQELEILSDRIGTERGQRLEALDAMNRESKEESMAVSKRLVAFDEQMNKVQRELRQQMLEQSSRMSDDLRARSEDLMQLLSRAVEELRIEKASRSSLASLFGELAMRLNGDLPIGVSE